MGISKVTRNFQVTLPSDIRALTGIKEGDKLMFTAAEGRVELRRIDKEAIKKAAGLWKGMKETGIEYENRLRKEWEHRT